MKTKATYLIIGAIFLMAVCASQAQSSIPPIKGISLGMPIKEAVDKMNQRVGPMLASLTGGEPISPYKLMRIPSGQMLKLRRELYSLVSLATMQLHPVEASEVEDLYIVVPQRTADATGDLGTVGVGVLQSVLLTGFFAWSGEDEKVKMFLFGPTICGALFDAQNMDTDEFIKKFSEAYNLGKFDESQKAEKVGARFFTKRERDGSEVAISQDEIGRLSLVVWNSFEKHFKNKTEGSFD
jgi:hypothetical protein